MDSSNPSTVRKQLVWIAVFDKERKHVLLKAFSGGRELGLMDGSPIPKETTEQAAYRIVKETTGLTGLRMLDPRQTDPVMVIREPGRDIHIYRFWHQDIRSVKADCTVRDYKLTRLYVKEFSDALVANHKWLIPMLCDLNVHGCQVIQYGESTHRSSNLNY